MKYTIAVDTHCHSIGSCHAFCTIEEILQICEKKAMQGVCITDHHESLGYYGSEYSIAAPDNAYFHVFCKRCFPDSPVTLFKGIEMNILDHDPWIAPLKPNVKNVFDIKNAGIHSLPHLYTADKNRSENTDIVLCALDTEEKPFNILVHPCYESLPLHYDVIVKRCAEKNIALELNNSALTYKKDSKHSVHEMLSEVKKQDALLAVSSDAHTANEVALFDCAFELLQQLEFPQELIVNRSYGSFIEFLAS